MPPTGSSWLAEAAAVFAKEAKVELRTRHGFGSAALFGVGAALAFGLGSFGESPGPAQSASALCALLVLASVVSLPRTFLVEEDQGTFDLLRLHARPDSAFAGKAAFVVVEGLAQTAGLALLYLGFGGAQAASLGLLAAALGLASVSMSAAVSLCGALALGAQGRYGVASAVSLPLLFPPLLLAYPVVRASLGGPGSESAWRMVAGLAGWAVALCAVAVPLAGAAWRLAQDGGPGKG